MNSSSTAPDKVPFERNEIAAMFGRIAPKYDLLNRLMTGGLDQKWRQKTVTQLGVRPGGLYCDLATGTADLALAIVAEATQLGDKDRATRVEALDISPLMLERAQSKITECNRNDQIQLQTGQVEALPFPDNRFDGVTIGFGIRNVTDRKKGLYEIYRILKPGGRLVILEAMPAPRKWQRALQSLHLAVTVRILGMLLSEGSAYQYLGETVAEFPSAPKFLQLMAETGFKDTKCLPLTFGAASLLVGSK